MSLVVADTFAVVMVKAALEAPASTVTLAGTCAAAVLLLLKLTMTPPLGATPFNVTVPCELFPATTLVGFKVTELTARLNERAPTVLVGSDAANFLIRKLLKLALVFPSP